LLDICVHPVKRGFDRKAAFKQAIAEMNGQTVRALQSTSSGSSRRSSAKSRGGSTMGT
jgi:hypothetical protein